MQGAALHRKADCLDIALPCGATPTILRHDRAGRPRSQQLLLHCRVGWVLTEAESSQMQLLSARKVSGGMLSPAARSRLMYQWRSSPRVQTLRQSRQWALGVRWHLTLLRNRQFVTIHACSRNSPRRFLVLRVDLRAGHKPAGTVVPSPVPPRRKLEGRGGCRVACRRSCDGQPHGGNSFPLR